MKGDSVQSGAPGTVHINLICKCNRLCSGHQKVSYFGYFPCHEWPKNVIAFSRKRALGNSVQPICCSIPIGNYQTVEIH